MKRAIDALGSLTLAVVGMTLLMLLVAACTLAQVKLGIHGAVEAYIRTAFVWAAVPGTGFRIPVFPGGGVVGALLIANLTASLFTRYRWTWGKAGLILTHVGVILLVAGEFQTAWLAHESMLSIEVGQTRNFSESSRLFEVALERNGVTVVTVSDRSLSRGEEAVVVEPPIVLKVLRYAPNAHLVMKKEKVAGEIEATQGAGRGLRVFELPPVSSDEETNSPAALVDVSLSGKSLGIWLLSTALAPQPVAILLGTYSLTLRPERNVLPFTLALKKFTHEVYPGTDIPRNFASLVHLSDPTRKEDRDVLIWMNHPLRYRGLTFYQASYGKGDTLSVLQVVRNPGWTLPYLACILVTIGLAWHFLLKLWISTPRGGPS